jgi:NAD(P)-dependent dehydrogenase (short-subunit alcohol dehydrogenase family)
MSQKHLHDLFDLDGRVAVVVGADEADGREVACGLGQLGVVVVVAGEATHDGHRTVELIRAFGGEAGFRHVDAACHESVEQLIDYSLGEHGRVDVLIVVTRQLPDESALAELDWQLRLFQHMTRGQESEAAMVVVYRHGAARVSFDTAFAQLSDLAAGDRRLWINAVVIPAVSTTSHFPGLVASIVYLAVANSSRVRGSVLWLG